MQYKLSRYNDQLYGDHTSLFNRLLCMMISYIKLFLLVVPHDIKLNKISIEHGTWNVERGPINTKDGG